MNSYQSILSYIRCGMLLAVGALWAAQGEMDFHHITNRDGLSMNTVVTLAQDSSGYLWIGTEDGLNRYDGRDFRIFRPHPWQPGHISGNMIESLCVDRNGVLWVGTLGRGLNRFDAVTESFIVYRHNPEDSTSLSHDSVYDVVEDSNGQLWVATQNGLCRLDRDSGRFDRVDLKSMQRSGPTSSIVKSLMADDRGNLWIGTIGGGLLRWQTENGRFHHYFHDDKEPGGLCNNQVTSLYQDEAGRIWIGTYDGLSCLQQTDEGAARFVSFEARPGRAGSLQSGYVTGVIQDRAGDYWVATWGGGLHRLNSGENSFGNFQHDVDRDHTLCSNRIYAIFEDASGVVWIGGQIGGLDRFHPYEKKFRHIQKTDRRPHGLNDNTVYSFCEPRNSARKLIWIGTNEGGINVWDPETDEFIHLTHDPADAGSLRNNRIFSLLEDRSGRIWAGTFGGGLNRFEGFIEKADGRTVAQFKAYVHNPADANSISDNRIYQLVEDRDGRIWIGTWSGGVNIFDPQTERFRSFQADPGDSTSLSDNQIMAILIDRFTPETVAWIGTSSGGLNRLNAATGEIVHFRHRPGNRAGISSDDAAPLYQDDDGRIWMATYGTGIDILDPATGHVAHITEADGLPSNIIMAIVPDDSGKLWISTYRGLCTYNRADGHIRRYRISDGLQDYEYNMLVGMRTASGEMLFGGNRGFNIFQPENVRDNSFEPPVRITEISFLEPELNASLHHSLNLALRQPSMKNEGLVLSYHDFPVTFSFAAMDYRFPEQNQYQYQLQGLNARWQQNGNRSTVSYTGLEPGTYTLNVRGSNSDGIWSQYTDSLTFRVLPPFWRTFWFRGIMALAAAGLMVGFHFWRIQTIRTRSRLLSDMNERLRLEVENRRNAEEQTARSLKEKELLLKEIHHRVKNNLQVISSLLSLQSRKLKNDDEAREMFAESRNRVRSMALIHECLYKSRDFSSIDFSEYFKELSRYLYQAYQINPRRVKLEVDVGDITLGIDDAVPCGLIVNELLSNAMKHAFPSSIEGQGVILVVMKHERDRIILEVQDNGVGMDESISLDQMDSLGLKMVNILVTDQLDGTLTVYHAEGTSFRIEFPVKDGGRG